MLAGKSGSDKSAYTQHPVLNTFKHLCSDFVSGNMSKAIIVGLQVHKEANVQQRNMNAD